MRLLFIVIFFVLEINVVCAQTDRPIAHRSFNEDSLKSILDITPADTNRVNILIMLSESYFFKKPEMSLFYSTEVLNLSKNLNYVWGIQNGLFRGGEARRQMGDFIGAMKMHFEHIEFNQKYGDDLWEAISLGSIGINYYDLQDYAQSISYLKKALALQTGHKPQSTGILFSIYTANSYINLNQVDSAFYYQNEAKKKYIAYKAFGPQLKILLSISKGDAYFHLNKKDSANIFYRQALATALANQETTPNHICMITNKLSLLAEIKNKLDSGIYFARYSYQLAKEKNLKPRILESSRLLSQLLRKKGNFDSAFYYEDIANLMNDSIYGKMKFGQLQFLVLQKQRKNLQIQQDEERAQNRIIVLGLVSISTVIMIAGLGLYRNNRAKYKSNKALERALHELKSTQSQLIQSEKMASLGELTAGIAHEIQNPLNFVNNFSEVNTELIDELKAETLKPKAEWNELLIKDTLNDIKENEQKIAHHGKRADAIVKGMLQHSRNSSGQKELTDINALCDEYLRLAYHGLRAKDKSFNAKFETHLDPTLPIIKVVPQDIGRVVLNLINNAFYAVSAKASAKEDSDYDPIVIVSTKNLGDKIEISVKDNGPGIPDAIKAKIFQPFFTTKPTGQGTGLGLSLSYDIVKAHGGELKVDTLEGLSTTFHILLFIR